MGKSPLQIIVEAFCKKQPHEYCISFNSLPNVPPENRCPLPYFWATHSPYKNTVDTRFFMEV
jgi:hypothetical protein